MATGGAIGTVNTGITFQNGATYNHNQNGGAIPTATWQTGSTCKVIAAITSQVNSTFTNSLSQNFYHFTWDCPSQTFGNVMLQGKLTTVNGDLTIANTGASTNKNIKLTLGFNGPTATACAVGGNFTISGGSQVVMGSGGNYTMTVAGNVILSSVNTSTAASTGNTPYTLNQSGSAAVTTLSVSGDFILNSGYLSLVGAAGNATLNIGRDLILNGGSVNKATGAANVNFVGTGSHTYTLGTATFAAGQAINYNVDAGSTLDLGTFALGSTAGNFTNNGTVIIRSTNISGAIEGNIPIQNRFFPGNASVIYQGAAAQFMGAGQPADGDVTTTINNAAGVTQVSDATIGGDLILQSGNLSLNNFRLTLGGNLTANSNTLVISPGASLDINGSGTFGALPISGGPDIANFSVNRSGGTVIVNNDLVVAGALDEFDGDLTVNGELTVVSALSQYAGTLTMGGTLNAVGTLNQFGGTLALNGHTLNVQGDYNADVAEIVSTSASSMIIDNAGTLPSLVHITGPMNTLSLKTTGGADFNVSTSTFAVTNLSLLEGAMNNSTGLSMVAGGTLTRSNGSMTASPGGTGMYNLVYTNSPDPIAAGSEFHATTNRVGNVTINGAAEVILTASRTINGTLTLATAGLNTTTGFTATLRGDLVAEVPTLAANMSFAGTTTISGSVAPELGNVTVQNAATLNLPAQLSVGGTLLINAGAIVNHNNGNVTLTSGTTQNVNANNAILYNLTVDKSVNTHVTLVSALRLAGRLTMTSFGSHFTSSGNLTLLSTADDTSGNASIGPLLNGTDVIGDVIVQRFMSAEGRIYRYLSSPVTNAPVSQMQDDFPVTGSFTNASTCTGCGTSPSLAYYDAATGAYVKYPVAINTETLQPGRGYSPFIRQGTSPSPGNGPVTWDVTGPINKGDVNLPIVHNPADAATWNLLGNPYPATVSWDSPDGWTKTNIGGIAIRDNGAGGTYLYWNNGVGDITDGLLATGQGFWVQTSGPGPVLTIHEQAKATSTGTFYREGEKNVLAVKLTRGTLWDRAYLRLHDEAILGDDRLDASKLTNDNFSFSTRFAGDTRRMAINSLNQIACGTELVLDLQFTKNSSGAFALNPTGSYTMDFDLTGSKFQPYKITLIDQYTGQQRLIADKASLSFTMTTDAASYATDRFKLVFEGANEPDLALATDGARTVCDNGDATVVVENSQSGFDYYLVGADNAALTAASAGNGGALSLTIPASSLTPGTNQIRVGVNSFCGGNTLTNTWQITRQVVAAPAVASASHCQPGSVELTASGAGDNGNYRWYQTLDATTAIGTGATYITPSIDKSRTYYASIVTAEGCEGARQPALAQIVMYDDVTITSTDTGLLTSSVQTGNQWYFNDQPINGATGATYKADKSGLYEVEVTIDGCPSKATLDYVVTGIDEVMASVSGYPNPAWKEVNISLTGPVQEINAVDITSVTGQSVGQVRLQGSSSEKNGTMNVEQLLQGVYLVKIQLPAKVMVFKFVKQ